VKSFGTSDEETVPFVIAATTTNSKKKKDHQPVISSHDVEDEPFIGERQTHAFEARTVTTQI
jgi:hypothetical protein